MCRSILLAWTVALLLSVWPSTSVGAAERPNVVVVLTDDQGWGDLSLNGNTNLQTPNIDSLAANGARFDRFYVCPVCSPTRAEFLTGRYHARGGVYSTSAGGERLNLDETTIADVFRQAGYATGAFGKWHNGMQYPYHPNGRGFDEFYGFCSGHWGDYFSPPLEHNGRPVQGKGFCIDDFTDQAMRFIESAVKEDQPFFAYLPYNTPHSPMQVPDPYWEKFESAELQMRHRIPARENIAHVRCALAMCENIDFNVGRLLTRIEQLGVSENTIVVYFCDNGPNGARWNGDMKGRKGSTDEGGVRSPLLVRWPAKIPQQTLIRPIGAAIDLLPTLAELADIPLQLERRLDGKSLAPLLLDSNSGLEWPDREIVSHWRDKTSIRNQRFRLDNQGALFEIGSDPGQRTNVAEQFPGIVTRLEQIRTNFLAEIDGFDRDDRPFLIGHRDFKYTQLPARDATASGGIRRSNKFPNCSYFTNWTRTDEEISWDVKVPHAGRFDVQLAYACAAQDCGSTVELAFGDARLQGKILEAFDPPVRGHENDRLPRVESYVKDFGRIHFGQIKLSAGEGRLTLSATDIPGDQVLEFRLMILTRVDD